jgi:hypothetical protein
MENTKSRSSVLLERTGKLIGAASCLLPTPSSEESIYFKSVHFSQQVQQNSVICSIDQTGRKSFSSGQSRGRGDKGRVSLPNTLPNPTSSGQEDRNSRSQQKSILNTREGERASSGATSTISPMTSTPSPEDKEINQLKNNFESFSASPEDGKQILKSKITQRFIPRVNNNLLRAIENYFLE